MPDLAKSVNILVLLARGMKVFKGFIPVKMLGLPPLLAFIGDTQLRKKKRKIISQPGDVFSREPGEDIDSTGSVTKGCTS